MPVTVESRWHGGSRDAVVAFGKQLKPIVEELGGEYRLGQIHTGANVGQWVATLRFPDWASYGKASHVFANDPAFQDIMAKVMAVGQLVDRTLIVGLDL
jgi:hypothetical protein